MKPHTKWFTLGALILLPILTGATCSQNAVAQSTATNFSGGRASGIAAAIVKAATGG